MSVRNDVIMALLDKLQTLRDNQDGNVAAKSVLFYDTDRLKPGQYPTPAVTSVDRGPEEVLVIDPFAIRYGTDQLIIADVQGNSSEEMSSPLNNIIARIKAIIESQPDLGPQCLDVQWNGIEKIVWDNAATRAWAWIHVRIVYVCTRGAW